MAERIVPAPSLTPVAAPVDRFIAPLREKVGEDPMLALARTLEKVNPQLQQFMKGRYDDQAAAEEAEGTQAESYVDPSLALAENREGWKTMIDGQRKVDRENGTAHADRLAAASPHFRRGLYKARARRMGMALNDHLMSLYSRNPEVEVNGQMVNLQSLDDATALATWAQQETAAYAAKYGMDGIDPLLAAEVFQPLAMQAQDSLMGAHTDLRLNRYKQEYMDEMSANAGMLMTHSGTGASSVDDFILRLAGRESGGNYSSVNTLGYTGLLQFGQDRLNDYNNAHGTSYTLAQFKEDTALQDKANRWHINDIDRVIREQGFLDKGWSLDGLRAVAHLGGIGGMKKFVMTHGTANKYDPKDDYGTSLTNYYTRFAGPSVELQGQLDDAIADGIDPTKANKTIVAAVITSAIQNKDPALLATLNDIHTGSGPLGNIGWVKAEVAAAEDRIQDQLWQEESRTHVREQREREKVNIQINTDSTQAILADPYMDITPLQEAAIEAGQPDLAKAMASFQEQLIDRDFKVRSNHERIAELRIGVATGEITDEDFIKAIRTETGINFPSSVAMQLMDDFANRDRYSDTFADRQVQASISDAGKYVGEMHAYNDGMIRVPGTAKAQEAEAFMRNNILDFIRENPEAGVAAVREYAYKQLEFIQKSPIWKPTRQENPDYIPQQRSYGQTIELTTAVVTSVNKPETLTPEQAQLIAAAAKAQGLTTKEYMAQFGAN